MWILNQNKFKLYEKNSSFSLVAGVALEQLSGFGRGPKDAVIAHIVDLHLLGFTRGIAHGRTVVDDVVSDVGPEGLAIFVAPNRRVAIAVMGKEVVVYRDVTIVLTGFEQPAHRVTFVTARLVELVTLTMPEPRLP